MERTNYLDDNLRQSITDSCWMKIKDDEFNQVLQIAKESYAFYLATGMCIGGRLSTSRRSMSVITIGCAIMRVQMVVSLYNSVESSFSTRWQDWNWRGRSCVSGVQLGVWEYLPA